MGSKAQRALSKRDEEAEAEYTERDELLRIEQAVVELRAKEVKERIKRKRGRGGTAPADAEDDGTDTALSLITRAAYVAPGIGVEEAKARFDRGDIEGARAVDHTSKGREGTTGGEEGDEEGFVGLDDWMG